MQGVGRKPGAADRAQLCLAREHLPQLFRAREHRDDAGKACVRHAHAGDIVAHGLRPGQTPEGAKRPADVVGHEPDRADRRVAERSRGDVEQRHRQHVAHFGALDVHRSGQRVHRADLRVALPRVVIRAGRVEVEVARVARLEDDGLPRPRAGRHRDRGVQPVDAARVLAAVAPGATQHDDLVLRRRRRSGRQQQRCDPHSHPARDTMGGGGPSGWCQHAKNASCQAPENGRIESQLAPAPGLRGRHNRDVRRRQRHG